MNRLSMVITIIITIVLASCVSISDRYRLRKADFNEFESWYKINDEPLTGAADGLLRGKHLEEGGMREVYVNDIGQSAFSGDAQVPLPEGTVIVKDTFYIAKDGTKGRRWNITVMRKREPGYDAEYNDWEYVIAGPGKGVRFQGRMPLCIDCHIAADKDFVFTWE